MAEFIFFDSAIRRWARYLLLQYRQFFRICLLLLYECEVKEKIMEYFLDREYNVIVKAEDGWAEYIPYSGGYNKAIEDHNPQGNVSMSPISSSMRPAVR